MGRNPLESLSPTRRDILVFLKNRDGATVSQVGGELGVSDEAARVQLAALESMGWLARSIQRPQTPRSGRPMARYTISAEGDRLFPKRYDELSLTLIDAVVDNFGVEALATALAAVVDRQVEAWVPRVENKTLDERLEVLRGFYFENDPFTTLEEHDGELVLVERNCPFRDVAMKRPELCSTTVSTLTRLLGHRVERRQRFQDGDGRCAFVVHRDQPIDPTTFRFCFEEAWEV